MEHRGRPYLSHIVFVLCSTRLGGVLNLMLLHFREWAKSSEILCAPKTSVKHRKCEQHKLALNSKC